MLTFQIDIENLERMHLIWCHYRTSPHPQVSDRLPASLPLNRSFKFNSQRIYLLSSSLKYDFLDKKSLLLPFLCWHIAILSFCALVPPTVHKNPPAVCIFMFVQNKKLLLQRTQRQERSWFALVSADWSQLPTLHSDCGWEVSAVHCEPAGARACP